MNTKLDSKIDSNIIEEYNDNQYGWHWLLGELEIWGLERGILQESKEYDTHYAMAQAAKTIEEVGELVSALNTRDPEAIVDAYGDILVTLLMGMMTLRLNPAAALTVAYTAIKDRTGKMVNGQFVKDK